MPQLDRFGLPIPPTNGESAHARARRKAEARWLGVQLLHLMFRSLANNLGNAEAARLFVECSKLARRRQRGSANPARDDFLLQVYEAEVKLVGSNSEALGQLPRKIGERLYQEQLRGSAARPITYGNSTDAIAKQIRQLIKEREKK